MGSQTGGGGNFNPYSKCTVLPYEGIINENYFRIKKRETELSANLETFKYATKNPFSGSIEFFIGMLIKSKYDGIGRKEDEIDISIALDISGSMSSFIDPKPTFKELALEKDEDEENIEEIYRKKRRKMQDSKNRLQIAKECLFKYCR